MILHESPLFFERTRHALAWGFRHTGIPVVVLAAAALVVSFRIVRKTARLALEIAVVAALLVAATKLGWIRF